MSCKLAFAIVVCLTLLLTCVVHSVEGGQTPTDHKSTSMFPFDITKFVFDLQKLDYKSMFEEKVLKKYYPPTDKLELHSPGFFDYVYLAYDIAEPLRAYHNDEISDKELCKQLFGAGGAFGGSVVGTSFGAYVGTMASPVYGTFAGGWVGGQIGYNVGKKVGHDFVGEHICESLI